MMHSTLDRHYIFPDLAAPWPTPTIRNSDPAVAEIIADSDQWISKMHSLCATPSWKAAFDSYNIGLITVLGYCFARGGHLRACADWINYIFTFDDYFEHMEPEEMEREAQRVMSVLEYVHTLAAITFLFC